ncbi:Predicted protein [Prochlorococcus marinus subsp. marinus str. CCMP1375]|uniref:Lipoprotein n=3 Tax=Prochlorococcaceae TaxID=2881426 RepID=Q7VCQ1_PROMA|nr:Predicted protein [Prochlorococcus marinus subsp. marinus str. CCMP1375]
MKKSIPLFLLTPILLVFMTSCQSERKSKYKECMNSGMEELYGENLTPDFCECFTEGQMVGESPFETGNRCAKPIIEEIFNNSKDTQNRKSVQSELKCIGIEEESSFKASFQEKVCSE